MSTEHIRNSISHASIQDNLLQTYRRLSLSFQSMLLAVGVFLLNSILSKTSIDDAMLLTLIFVLVGIFALWVGNKFTNIIIHRGMDVNFWHKQIILLEQQLEPKFRLFTKFKVSQKMTRQGDEYLSKLFEPTKKLTELEIDEIIGRGLGHTRKIIDKYIPIIIRATWGILAVIGLYRLYRL